MPTFIMGYPDAETEVTNDGKNLVLYSNAQEAAYESEEWCYVDAETEAEARLKYDETFERLKNEGKITGPFNS